LDAGSALQPRPDRLFPRPILTESFLLLGM
jgi:hypothetical protein